MCSKYAPGAHYYYITMFCSNMQAFNLHAEVSYRIDIACHWTFPVLATFWNAKPWFFPFSNSQFLPNHTIKFMFTNVRPWLLSWNVLLVHISASFGCCFTISSDFLWKFALNPKIADKQRKFQQNGPCFGSRNWETDANHVHMWFAQLC